MNLLTPLLQITTVSGTSAPPSTLFSDPDPYRLVNRGMAWAIILAFVLSVIFVFYGGVSFILSGGNPEKVKKATGTIRFAIIGLVFTLLATTIISVVGWILGFNFLGELINYQQIFSDIRDIVGGLTSGRFGQGSGSPRI